MAIHRSRKGLDLPILGNPVQEIEQAPPPRHSAILAADSVGLRPTMHVEKGDDVRLGQLLFEDKKNKGVRYTSPASGKVVAVNRGDRRALQSVVIELSREERERRETSVSFRSFTGRHPSGLTQDDTRELLIESGLWVSLRMRPFGRVADPSATPKSIFVTAMDSHPHAPSLDVVLTDSDAFDRGLAALCRLTDGPVFVCTRKGSSIKVSDNKQVQREEFEGPHPSGTVGFHIHTLDPVDRLKKIWHVGMQDVVAIGKLFSSGLLDVTRIVSIAGPPTRRPRLLRTRLGASVEDLLKEEVNDCEARFISGSVFSGRRANGSVHGYLGRYHQQISVLVEGREREFLGWLGPGFRKFSTIRTFLSSWIPRQRFSMTSSLNGSPRAIVPIGMFEKVMPFDLMVTPLMRALAMRDIERAEELGCLELVEEDMSLCSFVCVGKNDYGSRLRDVLDVIEQEG